MYKISKTFLNKKTLICLIVLVILAIAFSFASYYVDSPSKPVAHFVITILPLGLALVFVSLIFAYVMMCLNNKTLKFWFILLLILFAFWVFLRIFKILIQTDVYVIFRLIWYSYYVPFLFIPFLMVTLINYIFIQNKKTFRIVTCVLLVLNVCLLLIVLTNDLTQWVFVFDKTKPESTWSSNRSYERTWIYYVIFSLIGIEIIYCGTTIFYFTRKKKMLIAGIIYAICLVLMLVYAVCYLVFDILPSYLKDMTVVYLFLGSIIIYVSARYGLFISSGDYERFFDCCKYPLKVETINGHILENQAYLNMNKDIDYKCSVKFVNGSKLFVYKDVTRINSYNHTLKMQLDNISKNNKLLQKQKESMREKETKLAREQINVNIEQAMCDDIQKLSLLSESLKDTYDPKDIEQRKTLDEIYHLCHYLKRKSYLVLMEENSRYFTKESLQVFTKELLSEFTPKLQVYEVMVNNFSEMSIETFLKFVTFIYEVGNCLTSNYKLFLIFTMKEKEHFFLKINIIDYKGDADRLSNIQDQYLYCQFTKEDGVYVLNVEEKKNV